MEGVVHAHAHHVMTAGGVPGPGAGEALNNLEAEISELQRENARVESQMLRLRTDITAMEAHLRHDKVNKPCSNQRPSSAQLWSRKNMAHRDSVKVA